MPRRQRREVPRWRRGKKRIPLYHPTQFSGRQARIFAREYARHHAVLAGTDPKAAATLRRGAWRFRLHLAPFEWLAALIATAALLHLTGHAVAFSFLAGPILGALLVWSTRHLSRFARRASDIAALGFAAWLPPLTAYGTARPVPAILAGSWAVGLAVWVRRYRWRRAETPKPSAPAPPDKSDQAVWARLAKRNRWAGQLGPREEIPGGRKYLIELDGAETHIGQVMSDPRAIAAAWDKAQTEAYAEPHPSGVESRGYLTILRAGTLAAVREWDGHGFGTDGIARIGRYADGAPARIRAWVPRDGTRHGLAAGATGAGKSALLDLLVWLALMSDVPVVPVILDPQNGQSLPQWRDRVLYAAGFEECVRMVRGLNAGMLDRSRRLASKWWDDDGHRVKGMEFFDPHLSGLPVVMPIMDEAPLVLSGDGNAKLAQEMIRLEGDGAKLGRKTGVAKWLVAQVPSLSELGDQALRSMLVGGNVVCLRTGDRVSAGMIGLEADPASLPKYFPDGEPTGGLGYVVSLDNRQAPFRSDKVASAMRRRPVTVPVLEDEFLEAMDRAMGTQGVLLPAGAAQPAEAAEDSPEGRRCIDAVWQVLTESRRPMERGDIIWAVNALAQTWDRKPWSIRSVTDALAKLTAGADGHTVTKVRDGVYQAVTTQTP